MQIIPYHKKLQNEWDDFVLNAKNGGLFHTQKFLSYHNSEKWVDKSILIYQNEKIIGVFAACELNNEIISHAGSNCGGLIVSSKNSIELTFKMFDLLIAYFKYQP